MQVISSQLIQGKKVLLRLDLDVPIKFKVQEDFRLRVALPTLRLCLEHALEVIVMGHIGRPEGKVVPELSVEPIFDWLKKELGELGGLGEEGGKLKLLENLRFEPGEDNCDLEYAKELAALGEVFVNEAFAAHHPAASTTILPTLLPHAAGLRFVREVEVLREVRENPKRPLVVIIGGVKVEDKLPAVMALAKIADYILVGGKIASEISTRGPAGLFPHSMSSVASLPTGTQWGSPVPVTPRMKQAGGAEERSRESTTGGLLAPEDALEIPERQDPPAIDNVIVADLNEEGSDVTSETIDRWQEIINKAKMIVWNGPLGRVEDMENDQTRRLAEVILGSGAKTIVGGGDTVGYLEGLGLLGKFGFSASDNEREDTKADKPSRFISTGGGAMLEFLTTGTLPTIEVLN